MTELPCPLTGAECDLTDFPYMELDVRRLHDSRFASTPSGDAFRAGVLLWCAAWHQIPAASLPDNDAELANLAGFGRMPVSIRQWLKVRNQALHGFVPCSDGRLYHPVIAEKALAAFAAKQRHAYAKFLDRLRKENKAREAAGKASYGIPTLAQWKSGDWPHAIPPPELQIPPEIPLLSSPLQAEIPLETARTSGGIPPEIALKGNREGKGEGEGTIHSVPDGTGGAAAGSPACPPSQPPAGQTRDELWRAGKSLLAQAGVPLAQCGSFIGKLVKDYGQQVAVDAVRAAVLARPADPAEYLKAVCMRAAGQRPAQSPAKQAGFQKLDYRQGVTADGSLS